MYLDANNLYGCLMSQYLPSGGFKWMIKEKTEKLNRSKYTVRIVKKDYNANIYNNHTLATKKINVKKTYCQTIAKV